MAYVDVSNFASGFNKIAFNEQTIVDLTSFINDKENFILTELFGEELFGLFKAGVIAETPKYLKLKNPFIDQLQSCRVIQSKGVADMLAGFIYFDYSRFQATAPTVFGRVTPKGENSNVASFNMGLITEKYSNALDTYEAIQLYILDNLSDYPTFNGIEKFPILAL
jgi:hypothetical protein